jgi:hypothetical protein
MIDHPDFFNENLHLLAKKLKALDSVVLVKFHAVVTQKAIEMYGADTFKFSVVVEKHALDDRYDSHREFFQFVPKDLWNNPDVEVREKNTELPSTGHTTVVNRFTNTIKLYLENPTTDLDSLTNWSYQQQ